MNREELEGAIYVVMLLRPECAYVTPDGSAVYLLTEEKELLRIEGEDLLQKTPQELNDYIIEKLS